MTVTEELVARVASLEAQVQELQSRERPLVLRGWQDDFLGQSLDVRYTQDLVGATSTITLGPRLNGQVRLRTDTNVNDRAWLRLGDFGDGYLALDADEGFTMVMRAYTEDVVGAYQVMHAYDVGAGDYIAVGVHTGDVPGNWMIRCSDGVGSFTDSGVALDTDWHVHRMDVYPDPTTGGHRVDYFLDSELIAYQTTNIPTGLLTPGLLSMVLVGGDRKLVYIDYWRVEPKNLA